MLLFPLNEMYFPMLGIDACQLFIPFILDCFARGYRLFSLCLAIVP